MKRYLIAAGVGSFVFAAAIGSASVLGVDAGVAQTGQGVLAGDTDGVQVESWKAEAKTGESTGLRVADIDNVPANAEMFAVALNGAGNSVAESASVVYDASTGKATFKWKKNPSIRDIESLRLTFDSGDVAAP